MQRPRGGEKLGLSQEERKKQLDWSRAERKLLLENREPKTTGVFRAVLLSDRQGQFCVVKSLLW